MKRAFPISDTAGIRLGWMIFCPVCGCGHMFHTETTNPHTGARWAFNGNDQLPTFTPSYRDSNCHCTVTNGEIHFHNDHPNPAVRETKQLLEMEE